MALEFTDSNFQEMVMSNEGVVVIDFWAEWCGPCRMIGPIVEELYGEYKEKDANVSIGKVNVDNNPQISEQFGIRSIQTILFLRNGEIVDKQVGVTSKKALEDKINSALAVTS